MLTEQDALDRVERSPAAQSVRIAANVARVAARGAGLWPNPVVFLSHEESAGTTDAFISIGQTVPIGGRLSLLRSAAESDAETQSARSRLGLLSLRAEVRAAFFDLLLAQETSSSIDEGRESMAELVRILRAREEAGDASGFDRLRAVRELAEVEADLMEVEVKELRAQLTLSALLALDEGAEPVAQGDLGRERELPPLETLLSRAQDRGDVVALGHEGESAVLRGRAASRIAIPEPTLFAGTKRTDSLTVSGRGVVVSLTIPIPVVNRGQHAVALARAEESLVLARYQARLRLAQLEIDVAHREVLRRRESQALYRRAADTEALLRTARIAYDEGERGILELLDAYRTSLAVRIRGLALAAATRKAEIDLDVAVGEEVTR